MKLQESDEEKLLGFFREQLQKSGHSLENKVEDFLIGRFSVQREVPYIDKDEGKGRNIDLIAYAQIPFQTEFTQKQQYYVVGRLVLTIECKNLPNHGWIFFKTKEPEIDFPDKITIADHIPPEIIEYDPTRYYSPITPIPSLFNASGYDEYIYDVGTETKNQNLKKSNGQRRNLYDAVNKVTKVTRYQIETTRDVLFIKIHYIIGQTDKITAFAVFQPLIVFEGLMYGATMNGGSPKLESIKFAQIPRSIIGEISIIALTVAEEILAHIFLLATITVAPHSKQHGKQERLKFLRIMSSLRF